MRNVDPRWQPGNFEKNVEAVDRLAELAAALTDADIKAIDEILPLGASAPATPRGTCPPGSDDPPRGRCHSGRLR